jgi:hypothetical protein
MGGLGTLLEREGLEPDVKEGSMHLSCFSESLPFEPSAYIWGISIAVGLMGGRLYHKTLMLSQSSQL